MTVVLELKPEIEEALRKKASASGGDVNGYLESLIEKDMYRTRTLDEILAPVRKNFADSGMTEDELDQLLDGERQAMWDEKQAGRN